jgi:hypothetical protein
MSYSNRCCGAGTAVEESCCQQHQDVSAPRSALNELFDAARSAHDKQSR